MAKWGPKVVESNVTCLEYTRVIASAAKMADRCASSFEANSVALQRGCFTKNALFNSIFRKAICRSSCPIRYCIEKS